MQKNSFILLAFFLLAAPLFAQIEPQAGNWQTWLIPSGKSHRLEPPNPFKKEIAEVIALQQSLDSADFYQINYWNAGAPGYRWQALMEKIWMTDTAYNGIISHALLAVAIYDATIAAWDTKYAFNRPRPFAADSRIKSHIVKPDSPSYPCEHSVAAGVGATIIAHFFPNLADSVNRMAQRALRTRVAAGAAFPSDTRAGFELGKKIAEIEIAHSKSFHPKRVWDRKMPNQPGLWKGSYAALPLGGLLKTFVLDSGSQFRPGPPPDFAKDMAELKNFKQTFRSMSNAFFYASQPFWEDLLNKKLFEYNLHLNPPRAARMQAIAAIGVHDGFVACWDAKYTYWGIRPEQYDTTFRPLLIESPPFPGYPSGHAAVSSVQAELLSYFFPEERAYFQRKAKDVAESRFQGGIHFRTDNDVALDLGKKVAGAILQKVKNDGADEPPPSPPGGKKSVVKK